MKNKTTPIYLSQSYSEALDLVRIAHKEQFRKGSGVPYLSHLMSVSALVLEHGGDEEQAIAGLCHDLVEDCGSHYEQILLNQFGQRVQRMVMDCTDGSQEEKQQLDSFEAKQANWKNRKTRYLEHLSFVQEDSLLVSACDKLHNMRSIVADLQQDGLKIFKKFIGREAGTLWYYESLVNTFQERNSPVSVNLNACFSTMQALHTQLHQKTKTPSF